MATFNELLESQSPGICWLLEVVDSAGTVTYRYSSHSCVYSGHAFAGYLTRVGTIEKSFSTGALPASTTLELALDNTTNAIDWAVDRTTVASVVFGSRFVLYAGLYDASAANLSQPTLVVRKCGEYTCLDFPRRGHKGEVTLHLVDDSLGRLANIAQPPTLNEWAAAGTSTTSNCPVMASFQMAKMGNWDAPLPLVFGEAPVSPQMAVLTYGGNNAGTIAANNMTVFPVCATTETGTPSVGDVVGYFVIDLAPSVQVFFGATKLFIPPTATVYGTSRTLWDLQRSATITKGSYSWQILWIRLFSVAFGDWIAEKQKAIADSYPVGYLTDRIYEHLVGKNSLAEKGLIYVQGYPWSARTIDYRARQHPVDIVRDLISYYSDVGTGGIDTTSFAKVRDFNYGLSASGVVQASKTDDKSQATGSAINDLNQNVLQKTLGEICGSADMELFQLWGGTYGLVNQANGFEEQTVTWTELEESRLVGVEEIIPGIGERWAPYNRLFLDTGKGDPLGPFDNATGITDFGNRILPRVLKSSWTLPPILTSYNPWTSRTVESTIRPVLEVVTGLDGFQFDLGDFLTTSWTRGGASGPYTQAVFKVDGIRFDPSSNRTTLTLVWQDDLYDDNPFLLDSEALLIKSTGSGSRKATVTDASDVVSFSTGDIQAEGVAAGDFLVLTDSTLAGNNFTRYRALRILSVDGPKQVHVIDVDLDFDAPGGVDVDSWTIRTGFVNYPDSSSDPTNYPSDGDMYGKVANSGGVYTGSVPGNKMLNG